MGRYGLRQLCAFVLACGVYFGGIPHMYFLGLRGTSVDDFVAFALEAVLAWLLLAAVYIYWRQLTPLAVHCLCAALSLLMLRHNPDVMIQVKHFALAPLGPACWAAILISFPVSLVLLALSAVLDRRIEPLTNRLGAGQPANAPDSQSTWASSAQSGILSLRVRARHDDDRAPRRRRPG
jgi:hypothetical protein